MWLEVWVVRGRGHLVVVAGESSLASRLMRAEEEEVSI